MKKLLNPIFTSVFLATFSISHVNASNNFIDLLLFTGSPPKRSFDIVAENIGTAKTQPYSRHCYFSTQSTGNPCLDEPKERTVHKVEKCFGGFQDGVPDDVMKLIFIKASEEGTDPRNFELVCKNWHNSMGYSTSESRVPISGVFDHAYTTKRNDFFMEDCLHRYWGSPLNLLTLTYTDPVTGKVMSLKTSGSEPTLNGIFDLSECGKTSKYFRITTSVEKFFKVGGENRNKVVVLVGTHGVIKLHSNKFGAIDKWDRAVAPVGLFFRWGNWKNLTLYNYLVTSSMKELESKSLYACLGLGQTRPGAMLVFSEKGTLGLACQAFTFHFQTQSATYLADD